MNETIRIEELLRNVGGTFVTLNHKKDILSSNISRLERIRFEKIRTIYKLINVISIEFSGFNIVILYKK